jgi:hypothetical protein
LPERFFIPCFDATLMTAIDAIDLQLEIIPNGSQFARDVL